jgi:hypothetical protein
MRLRRERELTKKLQSSADIMDNPRAALMKKARVFGCHPNLHPPPSSDDFAKCITITIGIELNEKQP